MRRGSRQVRSVMTHWLLPVGLALVGVALTLPSLRVGLHLDDYIHWAIASGAPALGDLFPSRFDLFTFADGDPERTRRLMDRGLLPWWTFEGVRFAFWRPATSLTHWLDYTLWPARPALMHLQSLAWFGALIVAATLMYRRLSDRAWSGGVAALLYALDSTHALGAAWLANRNAVLAALFGSLCLWAHDRWRRAGWRAGALWGPGCLALGLMSAEAAAATAAYLAAHAVFLDRDAWRRRLLALLPYALVGAGWQLLYQRLGYGTLGASPTYVNPVLEPLSFAARLADHAPILLLAQWAGVPAESYAALAAPEALTRWLAALLGLGGLAVLLAPLLRRDRLARFWGLGHLLALPAVVAAPLSERYLFFVGLGAMGLLGRFVCGLLDREGWRPASPLWRFPTVAVGCFLAAVHLLFAPVQLSRTSANFVRHGAIVERSAPGLAPDPGVSPSRVVLLTAPNAVLVIQSLFMRAARGEPIAAQTLLLAPTAGPVQVSRLDERTLSVKVEGAQDFLFRPAQHPMSPGQQIRLTGATIRVTALGGDGRPVEARVTFDVTLEDPSLKWLRWAGDRYLSFTPPAVGGTADVR